MGGPAQHGFARPQSDRYSIAVRIGRLLMSPLHRARHLCGAPCDARSRRFHRCAPRAASRCSRDGVDALCAGFAHCLGIVAKLGGVALFIIRLMRARRDPHTNTLRTHVLQPATDGRVKRVPGSTTRWMGARFVGSSVRSVGGAAGLAWGAVSYDIRFSASGSAGYLVDPASSHMLVSKIKPCMSKYKRLVL